jgi:death on curing protein
VKRDPTWISKPAVLALHERLLAEHGGVAGILDEGLLDAALAAPKNRLTYERDDVFRLAAAYAHALTQNHPFSDGNKRVAFTVAGVFLELNGFRLEAPETEAVAAVLALTTRQLDEAQFADWLRASSSASPRRRHGARR